MIRLRGPKRAITRFFGAKSQDAVYALRGGVYAVCPYAGGEFSTTVTHNNTSFSASIQILRTGTYNDVLFAAGFSDTTVDYSIEVASHKVRLRINSLAGIQNYTHPTTLTTPGDAWVSVQFGWDAVTKMAFIIVDGNRQDYPHPDCRRHHHTDR